MKRSILFASVSAVAYPRRSLSTSHVGKSSYRDMFQKMNESDNQLILENTKKELTKTFGHPHVISTLSNEIINELHYILIVYTKPLIPERRIKLRNFALPYLEGSDKDKQKFFEYILKYYDIL